MTLIAIKAAKFGVVIMVLALSHGAWAENLLYRYKDENGGVVINDKIPQQYIDKGYTVINQYGDIIERVAPALTEEQLGQMEESERAKIEARRRQAKVDAADQKLLKTFADPEDAERARDRQLEAIDIMIEITQGIQASGQISLFIFGGDDDGYRDHACLKRYKLYPQRLPANVSTISSSALGGHSGL